MMISVYVVRCLDNDKLYVGVTKGTVANRWKGHCKAAKYGSTFAFHAAIRKHGKYRFEPRLASEHDVRRDAFDEECRLIAEMGTHVSLGRGYNMTAGGEGFIGLSQASLRSMAEKHRRENLSAETLEKMRVAKIGVRLSDETKLRMSTSHKGKVFSEEHKKKIGLANSGTNEVKHVRISQATSVPVVQSDLRGNVIAAFPSMKRAAELTGIHATNISGCCCGIRKHAGGFLWSYAS